MRASLTLPLQQPLRDRVEQHLHEAAEALRLRHAAREQQPRTVLDQTTQHHQRKDGFVVSLLGAEGGVRHQQGDARSDGIVDASRKHMVRQQFGEVLLPLRRATRGHHRLHVGHDGDDGQAQYVVIRRFERASVGRRRR